MKRIILGALAAVSVAATLSACSGVKNYANVDELKTAYVAAGGDCAKGQKMDLSAISKINVKLKGLEGMTCTADVALFHTTSKASRDALLNLFAGAAATNKVTLKWVYGETWLVGGTQLDPTKFADKLGGSLKK